MLGCWYLYAPMPETQMDQKPDATPRVEEPYREEVGLKPNSVWPDILVLAASLLVLCWGLGRYGLYEPHEGHFAGVSREMVLSGDWLTPHLNGSPYLNKPPLLYWSMALSQSLFGINEWAARMPLALYGWLGVLVAWAFAREVFGRAAGRLAAGLLTVSAGWFLFTHQLLIDALLSSLHLAAVYGFWRATREPERKRHWLCFYGSLALAMMAKGPIGLVFPGVVALGFMVVRKRWDLLRHARLWWGIPLAVAPVVIWAVLIERRYPGFIDHIVMNENVRRIGDKRWPKDYGGVQVGPLAYLATAAVWCAPWVLFACQTIGFTWRRAVGGQELPVSSEVSQRISGGASDSARRDAVLLLALAALVPVLIFLPVPARLIYYCLPATPPFMVLVAGWWMTEGGEQAQRRFAAAVMAVAGAAIFSAGFWVIPVIQKIPELAAAPGTLPCIPWMAWLFGLGLLAGGHFLWQARPRAAGFWACALCGAAWLFAIDGFTGFQDVLSSKRLVEHLNPSLGEDATWVSEGSNEMGAPAGIAYYLGRDEFNRTRTVFVMDDDQRRPQPAFAPGIPRQWAMNHDALNAYWASPQPVVFVTDPMRRDWQSPDSAPLLPDEPGEPVFVCGFRRIYANQAARDRMEWHDLLVKAAQEGHERPDDPYFPLDEKRLTFKIRNRYAAEAELQAYIQERPRLRLQRWTGAMSNDEMFYMLSRPGETQEGNMAVYCFKDRDFIRFYAPK
jgi:4-amino-4-deoxy-L-arabinose transferase-like glycosyltransferase